MKKVIGIVGSPRREGNVSATVNEVLKGVTEKGASTKVYYVNEMDIKGCQNCMNCRKDGMCTIDDAMGSIIEDIKDADAVVIGSPVYIWQVSGQTKVFMDRMYPLTDENHKPRYGNKRLVMVYTQAAPFEFFFKKYFKYMRKVFKDMGLNHFKDVIVTKCIEPGVAANNQKAMKKAYNTGKALSQG